MDRIEAVDAQTVKVTTKASDATLLITLAMPPFIILVPEAIERYSDLKSPEAQVGTGPFILDRWARDTGGRLLANPTYWRAGLPYLSGVEQLVATQDTWSHFLADRLQHATVPDTEISNFDQRYPSIPYHKAGAHGGHTSAIARIPNTRRPPFDDERARKALGLLSNRQKSAQFQYFGLGRPSIALGWDHELWNLSVQETERLPGFRPNKDADIREAHRLLEAAGYTRQNPMRFTAVAWAHTSRAYGNPALEFLKSDLEQSSDGRIQVDLRPLEFGTWKDVEARGEFQVTTAPYYAGLDPDHVLSRFHHSQGGRNYGRYSDTLLDQMLDKQRSTLDIDKRKALIHDIQRYIAEKSPITWMVNGPGIEAWRPYVRGFQGDRNAFWQLEHTWLDR